MNRYSKRALGRHTVLEKADVFFWCSIAQSDFTLISGNRTRRPQARVSCLMMITFDVKWLITFHKHLLVVLLLENYPRLRIMRSKRAYKA